MTFKCKNKILEKNTFQVIVRRYKYILNNIDFCRMYFIFFNEFSYSISLLFLSLKIVIKFYISQFFSNIIWKWWDGNHGGLCERTWDRKESRIISLRQQTLNSYQVWTKPKCCWSTQRDEFHYRPFTVRWFWGRFNLPRFMKEIFLMPRIAKIYARLFTKIG